MPYSGFKWVEPNLERLGDFTQTSPIGRTYGVDISDPKELHNLHNDLPFLPENKIPPCSKVKKTNSNIRTQEKLSHTLP